MRRPAAGSRPAAASGREAASPEAPEARNVTVNTANGAVQAVAVNLYTPFIPINLIRMGGSNFEVGLLSSLPQLAALVSNISGARWLSRRRDPTRATAAMFAASRLLALGLALTDLLVPRHPSWWWPATLVAVYGLLSLPNAIGTLGWQALLSGLLSARRRGPALAARLGLASLIGVTVSIVAGWLANGRPGMEGYVWLYALAAGFGLLEAATFLGFRGSPTIQRLPTDLLGTARRLWSDRSYRDFSLSCLPFYLGWLMAWPLFPKYIVSYAHADNLWVGAYAAVNALAGTAGYALWERIGRRTGVPLALGLSGVALAAVPAVYLFSPGLWGVMIPQVAGGVGGGGVSLLLLVRLMEVSPEADRVVAMGVNGALMGTVGVLGPVAGMALWSLFGRMAAFSIATGLRFGGGLVLVAAAVSAARAAWPPRGHGRATGPGRHRGRSASV